MPQTQYSKTPPLHLSSSPTTIVSGGQTGSGLQRTERNVRDSDATVLFSIEPTLIGGSLKTVDFARKHQKPNLHLCARDKGAPEKLRAFVQAHGVKVLNVAGPRANKESGVGEFVMIALDKALTDIVGDGGRKRRCRERRCRRPSGSSTPTAANKPRLARLAN